MTRRQLLIDYGEVISLPQPEADIARLAELAGLPGEAFTRRYWQHREPYDQGQPARSSGPECGAKLLIRHCSNS